MTNEAAFVFAVIAVAAVLMASNRVRFDIVSVLNSACRCNRKIFGTGSVGCGNWVAPLC